MKSRLNQNKYLFYIKMSFSDNHFNGITIPSVWKSGRNVVDSQTQTQDIETIEKGISVISCNQMETQTMGPIDSHKTRPLKTFDSPELTRFVSKASEITIDLIRKSKDKQIIDRIEKYQNQSKANVSMICKFYKHLDPMPNDKQIDYCVSAVSWNSNASVLAVGHKARAHTDWCTHSSFIHFWSLFKASKSEEPSIELEIDGCVASLMSHPTQPYIYFSGAFNGKISVWNTRNSDDPLIASEVGHQTAVSHIHWIQSEKRPDFGQIVSSGFDGKVLVWKMSDKGLQLEKAFVVLAQDMPKSMQIKRDSIEVGITSMSFNCDDPNIFLIGCIGGPLFQCSLLNEKPILNKNVWISEKYKNFEVKSPIVMTYASHRSHINTVEFSPVSRNTFFSISSDNELRVYNILQTLPLLVIHTEVPLVSGKWSPSRPNIAGVGTDGRIYVYSITDTKVSKASLIFSIGDQINAKYLVYNTIENNEQMAVIASNNQIQVWDLSDASQKTDNKTVSNILNRLTNDEN